MYPCWFSWWAPVFIAIAILLFAFTTVLGWSHYGTTACEYLFGTKSTIVYKITANYVKRKVKGEKIEPMLSVYPEIQAEQAADMGEDE